MPRRMSCSMTVPAVVARSKTVTRRDVDTWKGLKPGDRLVLVEKAMGLAKGERQRVLAEVEVVDVRVEYVGRIFDEDGGTAREGLGHMSNAEFVRFWCDSHCSPASRFTFTEAMQVLCRRIEWRYL